MATDIDPPAALERLFSALAKMGQSDLGAEIQNAVATGTLAKVEVKHGKIEEARKAYTPIDAYLVAVRLLVAAIDPLIMEEDARQCLAHLVGGAPDLKWMPDFLVGAQPSPEALDVSAIPSVAPEDLKKLRDVAVRVLDLINSIEAENG